MNNKWDIIMQKITAFQKLVYAETKKIPRGKVLTYADIARRIGRPKAARAVGSALHKNPFAPTVPCHRVVRSDGRVGGFAFGQKEKIARLEKEGILIEAGRMVRQ
ncbi:MAG: MGMT family protein [Parcubacteria group bacterium]|jgi:O-6-methylguanine DNA methyltransferase